ncbi:hypothetical protein DFH09DRAFT_331899 [Mycena vulgaris]|nr:hypothetical protein DFH09DRAFT_331899 [Mycena vulgaris]
MNRPSDMQPVPTSVLESYANHSSQEQSSVPQNLHRPAQQQQPSQAVPHGFTPDGHYVSPARPAAYPTGYPTPPSRPVGLTSTDPPQRLPNPQSRTSTPTGTLFIPDGHAPSLAHRGPLSVAHPTPPPAGMAALSPDEQRPPLSTMDALSISHLQRRPLSASSGSQPPTPTDSRHRIASGSQGSSPSAYPPPAPNTHWQPTQSIPPSSSQLPIPADIQPPQGVRLMLPPRPQPQRSIRPAPLRTTNPPIASSSRLPTLTDARAPPITLPQSSLLPGSAAPYNPQFSLPQQQLPTPTSARPPAPLPRASLPAASLPAVQAAHTHGLEERIRFLERSLGDAEDAKLQLSNEVVRLQAETTRMRTERDDARAQRQQLLQERQQLLQERNTLGQERDQVMRECLQLRQAHDRTLEKTVHMRRGLDEQMTTMLRMQDEHAQAQLQDRERLAAMEQANEQIRAAFLELKQKATAHLVGAARNIKKLTAERAERAELSAQLAVAVAGSGEEAQVEPGGGEVKDEPSGEAAKVEPAEEADGQMTAPDAERVPKPEPMEDFELELQYPSDASTSASASTLPAPSIFTWDPPPDRDRKRSRAEYEVDDDAADGELSLGPAFPVPRAVDVKALNSPLNWYFEVRRRGG